jgi:hypothetical protein
VGPNSGDTACPDGEYCTLKSGCIKAPVCGSDDDCKSAWKDDPCKTNVACDGATATCTFETLDRDEDGFAPVACGGDDCDDADNNRYPANHEVCDGKDNNCDGDVDEQVTCGDSLQSCQAGSCTCKSENACGTKCVDKQSDNFHCGDCDTKCPVRATCVDGVCACANGETVCDGACWDLEIEPKHCGDCDTSCRTTDQSCVAGVCVCDGGMECDGVCLDVSSDDAHCGACDTPCSDGLVCVGGKCIEGSRCDRFGSTACGDCNTEKCFEASGGCGSSHKCLSAMTTLQECMCAAMPNAADCLASFSSTDAAAQSLGDCFNTSCAAACGFD